ncbi:MAG: hypothetical protein EB084_14110 [Proteobacteria bacterium]|nr:hypothetical protein [Pseudomonadota bacterium]
MWHAPLSRSRLPAPRLSHAVLVAFFVNLIPTASMVFAQTFDAETHLFFADHYANGWFEGWEPRWYGGFWVFSYPPLLHQLVALVAKVTDLETACRCVQLGILTALPLSVWLLADALADRATAGWAAAFAVASAGVYTTVYSFGQLPTMAALVLALAATASLARYLSHGRAVDLVAWTGLGGACVATHHLTGIVGLPMLAVTVLLWLALRRHRENDASFVRNGRQPLIAALTLGLAAVVVLVPFVWWSHHGRVMQTEIPHATRTAFLSNPGLLWLLVPGEWGPLPLLAPVLVWACFKRREMWAFTALVALLATLSLGPAYTSVPGLMFPGLSYWLTYERFALWGALVALLPLGAWVAQIAPRPLALALLALFASVALQAATYTTHVVLVKRPAQAEQVTTVANWLSSHGRDRWRYVTFGFSEGDMPRLSRISQAQTIDGTYFTARRDPLLSRSGMGCVDTVAEQSNGMMNYVRVILSHPEPYSLRWSVCASPQCARLLQKLQWQCLYTVKDGHTEIVTQSAHPPEDGLTIWEAPARCVVPEVSPEVPSAPAVLALIWGVAPLSLLVLGLIAGVRAWLEEPVTTTGVPSGSSL